MLKNKRLSTVVAIVVSVVVFVAMILVYLVADSSVSKVLVKDAENNMHTSLDAKSQIINEYINNAETTLLTFSKSGELRNFYKDTTNAENQKIAQKYNSDFYSCINKWEGIYSDDWNTKVLTHSNEKVVGMVTREGDALKQLQDSMLASENGVYNTGIMQSPATGELIISMYCPIYDDTTPIGIAGGAVMAAGMKELLDATTTNGMESASYSLINVEKGLYIFDQNEDLIFTEIEDPALTEVITRITEKGEEVGTVNYTDENGVDYCSEFKSIPERGWALVIRDTEAEIYHDVYVMQYKLFAICVLGQILIVFISWFMISRNMKPLKRVVNSINRIKNLDLTEDGQIKAYIGKKSEIGQIATAVDSLTETFRDMVSTLNECSKSLAGSTKIMSATSRDLMDSVENNMATTEELSASIISTNSSIDAVTSEIEKINEIVSEIDESVKDGTAKSEVLIKTANDMNDMAGDTLINNKTKIENTKKKIEEAMDNLQSLVKINEMATQILDITSQTNLLSLNASIEAARAGEAGRGFAVVAGEIGSLADSSSKTVNEIQSLCEEANSSIASVKECFEDIITFMEGDISGKFQEFADIAKEYEIAVSDIKNAISDIDSKSSSFVESVQSIKVQVDRVSAASNDNANGVEDIVQKNNQTTMTVDAIISIANDNQTNADAIKDIIEQFK